MNYTPGDTIRAKGKKGPLWLVIKIFKDGTIRAERVKDGRRRVIKRPDLYERFDN